MDHTSPNLLTVNKVNKTYFNGVEAVEALKSVSLSLPEGDSIALVGQSGCGKSTLLLLMAGLEPVNSGYILFEDKPVLDHRREIALVLQDYGLFPWKSVQKNVELGLNIRNVGNTAARIDDILTELGIGDKAKVYPQQLSGGQKQRVALARAMVLKPRLLLLDEPFAALDTLTRERLQDLLLESWARSKFGMILATHNVQEAVMLGRRIVVMTKSPGRITDIIDNPHCGEADFRGSDLFYQQTRTVRRSLEAAE